MLDEVAFANEVARRRRLLVVVGCAVIAAAIRVVLQLSVSTVTRMQERCATTINDPTTGDAITVQLPCNPASVPLVEAWRWPVMIVVVAIGIAATGLLWRSMPQFTARSAQRGGVARIWERRLPGSRVRYRLFPARRWLMYVFAAGFVMGGTLLGVLPTGAPLLIVVSFIAAGALLAYIAESGVVTVSTDRLTIRATFRRKEWLWSQIESVDAVDLPARGRRPACRVVAIRTVDGKVFMSQSLSSAPGWAGPSRVDLLVDAINQCSETRLGSDTASADAPSEAVADDRPGR